MAGRGGARLVEPLPRRVASGNMNAHPGWISGIAEDGAPEQPFRAYLETASPPYRRVFIGTPCRTREGAEAEAERFLSSSDTDTLSNIEEWIRR
jgi:hypothetical protein